MFDPASIQVIGVPALVAGTDPRQIQDAAVFLIALILSIAVHEYGHALIADKLGDPTPRHQGRVTLNPMVHADPLGTFIFPLVSFFLNPGILFGWGKPVMVNPLAFTRRFRMKIAHLFVAIAGPAMNVALALLVTALFGTLVAAKAVDPGTRLAGGIVKVIYLNWILFFFNLIPCPPLDGGTVLAGLLPDKYEHVNQFLRQYGFFILFGLLITGAVGIFVKPALWLTLASVGAVGSLVD